MKFMTHCLTEMLSAAPGAVVTAVVKETVEEMNYSEYYVLLYKALFRPCSVFGPELCSFLAPLVTF